MLDNNIKNKTAAFVNLKENENVARYVKDITKFKTITAKEERELFDRYYSPSTTKAEQKKILDEIINRNQRYVYAVAKRYCQDDQLSDLISEGNLGLIEAFKSYDPSTGNRYCTHADYFIRRRINHYIVSGNVLIKQTNATKTLNKLVTIQDKYFASNGRFMTNDELKEVLMDVYNVKIKDNSDLFDLKIDSINMGFDDEDDKAFENSKIFVSHSTESEDDVFGFSASHNDSVLEYLKSKLNEKEFMVIELMYGPKELSNKEVGEILGVTPERARQIKLKAIEKMKKIAEAQAITIV